MIERAGLSFTDVMAMPDVGTKLVLDFFFLKWIRISCGPARAATALPCARWAYGWTLTVWDRERRFWSPWWRMQRTRPRTLPGKCGKNFWQTGGICAMLEQMRRGERRGRGGKKCVAINYIGPFTLASQMMGVIPLYVSAV